MLTSNRIGKDMQALVQDGCTLSISSRGLGSLQRTDKGDQVQDDFQIVSWDLVVQPSTPKASFFNQNLNRSMDQQVNSLIQTKKTDKTSKVREIADLIVELLEKE